MGVGNTVIKELKRTEKTKNNKKKQQKNTVSVDWVGVQESLRLVGRRYGCWNTRLISTQ